MTRGFSCIPRKACFKVQASIHLHFPLRNLCDISRDLMKVVTINYHLRNPIKLSLTIELFTVRLHLMLSTLLRKPFSVRLSVCQTRALWQNERKLCPHSYTMKERLPSFPTRRTVGGDDLLFVKFWAKVTPFEQKRRCPIDIRSCLSRNT